MSRSFNVTRAAAALVEADYRGDRAAAEAFGVSVRAVESWRARVRSGDSLLVGEYLAMAKKKAQTLAEELPQAIRGAIAFLERSFTEGNPADPKTIEAVNGSLSTLTEVMMILQRLEQMEQPDDEAA